MAAEQLLSTIKKQAQIPETPLASQPKVVQPPAVTPQINPALPQTPINQPPSINPAYRTPEVRATPEVAYVPSPWKSSDKSKGANLDYVPTGPTDAAFGDSSLTQAEKTALTQNYLKSKGFNMGPQAPQSDEESLRLLQDEQIREKTMLDKRIEQGLASAKKQLEGSTGAINATVGAVNREGLVSAGNKIAANQALEGFNLQFNQLSEEYAEQQRQLAKAQKEQNWDAANKISVNMSRTQAALAESSKANREESQGWLDYYAKSGLLTSASPEQLEQIAMSHGIDPAVMKAQANATKYKTLSDQKKAELDLKTTGIDALGKIFKEGGEMKIDQLTSLAKSLGLDMDTAASIYQAFDATRKDTTLSAEEKSLKNQGTLEEVKQKQAGIFTTAQQNYDYLAKMYNRGATPAEISAYKSAANITDVNDPKYQAELEGKQIANIIEGKKSRGEPLSAVDRAAEAEALRKISFINGGVGGSDNAYVPTKPLEGIQVSTDQGAYKIIAPPDKEFQCGAFVNRAWGLSAGGKDGFPSLGVDKMAKVNERGIKTKGVSDEQLASQIKPGMAFVMPIANNVYDHVGLVGQVLPDGIIAIEANANGKATTNSVGPGKSNVTSDRFIPWSQLYGFVPPPENKVKIAGKSENIYQMALKEAQSTGLPYEEAVKIATEKTKNSLGASKPADATEIRQTRKEFQALPVVKKFQELSDSYNGLQSTYDTYKTGGIGKGIVDQGLTVMFNKMLDPGSVVREGEYARTAEGQAMLTRAGQYFTKLQEGGGGIDDKTREDMVNLAKQLQGVAQKQFNQQAEFYAGYAKELGTTSENILGGYSSYYKPENPNQEDISHGGYTLPGAGKGAINSTKHISSSDNI